MLTIGNLAIWTGNINSRWGVTEKTHFQFIIWYPFIVTKGPPQEMHFPGYG
jgi:hypothetical protein